MLSDSENLDGGVTGEGAENEGVVDEGVEDEGAEIDKLHFGPKLVKKRKCLSLEERVQCIRMLEIGRSSRYIAEEYGVGKTQVQNLLKRKHEIIEAFEENADSTMKRRRESEFSVVNNRVYNWYLDASCQMVTITGPLLKQKALEYASQLGLYNFKGSNGWLQSFMKRYNILLTKVRTKKTKV